MNLVVSPALLVRYPGLRVSFARVSGLRNGPLNEALRQELRAAEAELRSRLATVDALDAEPRIVEWRELYRSFDVNPRRSRPSAEALARRVINGGDVPSVNLATNAYLLSQLKYLLPIGGYDLQRIRGDIHLRPSRGGEVFVGINATEAESTAAGEVVYADEEKVLTRRWNYKDCDAAKIDTATTEVALFIEAAGSAVQTETIVAVATEVAASIVRHCGGVSSVGLLDTTRCSSISLT